MLLWSSLSSNGWVYLARFNGRYDRYAWSWFCCMIFIASFYSLSLCGLCLLFLTCVSSVLLFSWLPLWFFKPDLIFFFILPSSKNEKWWLHIFLLLSFLLYSYYLISVDYFFLGLTSYLWLLLIALLLDFSVLNYIFWPMALKHEKISILLLTPTFSSPSFAGFIWILFPFYTLILIFFLILVCGQMDLVLTDSLLLFHLAEIYPPAVLILS